MEIDVNDKFKSDYFHGSKAVFVEQADRFLWDTWLLVLFKYDLTSPEDFSIMVKKKTQREILLGFKESPLPAVSLWEKVLVNKINLPNNPDWSTAVNYFMYYEEKKRVLSEDDEVRSLWKAAIQEYCEYVKAFRGSCFNVYLNKAVRFVLYHVVPRGRIEASSMKDEIEGYKSRCKEFMEKASGTNNEQENKASATNNEEENQSKCKSKCLIIKS